MPGGMLDVGGIEARLGAKVDERGFREFDRAMAKAGSQDATATLEARVDEKGFLRFKSLTADADKSTKGLLGTMRDANITTTFFSRALSLIKWPAFIAAAGVATQGVTALGGGVVALTSALAPLGGLLVGYPALLGAFGQAAGVVALAGVKDLTDAMAGNEDALKRLTPRARGFLDTLKEFQPQFDNMRKNVQEELFGGLDKGIQAAAKNFPRLTAVMDRTASVMGGLAEKTGNFLGREGFGRDFQKIGQTNARLLGRLGQSGLNFADALRHVLRAARPLIDWMGKLIEGWSRGAKESARAGRESGKLAKFFNQTRKTAERLFSIVGHLTDAFGEIGKAAAPLGRLLLKSFDDSAKSFERWTKSMEGKNALKDFFKDIRGPLFEMGRLVRDLGEGFLSIGTAEGLKPLIRTIRTELLPPVVEMVETTTKAFGPAMLDFLVELAKLMTNFSGGAGPLTLFVKGLTKLTEGLNWIMDESPAIKGGLVTVASGFAVFQTIGMASAISNLFGFRRGVEAVKGAPLIGPVVKRIGQALGSLKTRAFDAASDLMGNLATGIRARAGRVRAAIGRAMVATRAVAASAAEGVGTFVGGTLSSLRAKAGRLASGMGRIFSRIAVTVGARMAAVMAGAIAVGEGVGAAAGGLIAKLNKRLPASAFRKWGGRAGRAFALGFLTFGGIELADIIRKKLKIDWDESPVFGKPPDKGALWEDSPFSIDLPNPDIPGFGGQRGGLVTPAGILPFQGFQFGGMVGPGPRDTVPAMLEPGELVIPKSKVKRGVVSPVGEDTVKETEKRTKKIRKRIEDDFGDAGKKAKKEQKDLERNVGRSWRNVDREHDKRSGAIKRRTSDTFGSMADTARTRSDKLSGSVGKSMGSVQRAVYSGMDYISDAVAKAMKAFDQKSISLSVPKPRGDAAEGRAAGGLIPGYSRTDNRTIRVRGGERVLRPEDHVPFLNSLMMGTLGFSLDDYLKGTGATGYSMGGLVPGFAKGGKSGGKAAKGDTRMAAIISEANRIDRLKSTYQYGGGHVTPAPASPPWDCSSSLSRLLQYAGYDVPTMVSGDFASRFPGGEGAMTIYSNPGHVYAVINGRAWGTSGENPGGGPGWIESYTSRPGFQVSHIPGLSGASGVGTARIKRPLVEGTKGPMLDIAQGAIDTVHRGAQGKLKRAARRANRASGQAFAEFGSTGGGLPQSQIEKLWRKVNPGIGDAHLMSAIAMPESGGDAGAHGPPDGRGLYQIEWPVWGPTLGKYGNPYNASANTRMARDVLQQQGLSAWVAYNTGAHLPFMAAGGLVPGGLTSLYSQLRGYRRPAARLSALQAALRGSPRGDEGGILGMSKGERQRIKRRIERLRGVNPRTRRQDRLRGRIAGLTIGGYDDLFRTTELEGASPGAIGAGLRGLRVRPGMGLGALGTFGTERASQIQRSLRIGAAQRRVFANPGFAAGGVVGSPPVIMGAGGGGGPITLIFQEDSGAFVGKVTAIQDGRERQVARRAGVSRYTPSSTGRVASYAGGRR